MDAQTTVTRRSSVKKSGNRASGHVSGESGPRTQEALGIRSIVAEKTASKKGDLSQSMSAGKSVTKGERPEECPKSRNNLAILDVRFPERVAVELMMH